MKNTTEHEIERTDIALPTNDLTSETELNASDETLEVEGVIQQNLLKQQAHSSEETSYSLGQQLKLRREKFDWTEDYVASRLHLKKSIISQLENDECIDISSTFLRGYVRAYAKLLGLPEQELLASLDKNNPHQVTSPKVLQTYEITKKRRRHDGWFKMFSGLVIFTTLGVTGAWWWKNYQQDKKELGEMSVQQSGISVSVENLTNPSSQNSIPLNNTSTEGSSANTVPVSITPGQNQIELNLQDANGLSTNPLLAGSPSSLQSSGSMADTNTQSPITNLTVQEAVVSALPVATATATQENATTDASQRGIAFTFTGDSWLEVVDNKGKVLFSGMKRKEDTLSFAEGAPFKLKLGAPATVNLSFDGKVVDLTDYIKTGRVARLTVPTSSSATASSASSSTDPVSSE